MSCKRSRKQQLRLQLSLADAVFHYRLGSRVALMDKILQDSDMFWLIHSWLSLIVHEWARYPHAVLAAAALLLALSSTGAGAAPHTVLQPAWPRNIRLDVCIRLLCMFLGSVLFCWLEYDWTIAALVMQLAIFDAAQCTTSIARWC